MRRILLVPAVILAGLVAGLFAMPAAALAAPKPSPSPSPSPREPVHVVHLSGDGLPGTIELTSVREKQREAAVRAEVDWLATAEPTTTGLLFYQLGPKFTIVLLQDDKAYLTFDVYPAAQGGPRVFRPAKQPDGHEVSEGWFFGRLSMAASLYAAGVPMSDVPANPGGEGGGAPATDTPDLPSMLGSWRDFMWLNIAVAIIVAAGVFALAYVLRQRV